MQQFIKTIGHIEPSYVIRKFLDSERLGLLVNYLQALHHKGLGNSDHTTLLINCYAKLKDSNLDSFLKVEMSNSEEEWLFDVETAIHVCRSAGYFTQALFLAEKYKQHEWYMKIQLENMKQYKETIKYLTGIPLNETRNELIRYGSILLTECTNETTDLIILVCSGHELDIWPEEFIHLFSQVNFRSNLIFFLETIISKKWNVDIKIKNKVLFEEPKESTKEPSKDSKSRKIVWNTLLEMYLHMNSLKNDNMYSDEYVLCFISNQIVKVNNNILGNL